METQIKNIKSFLDLFETTLKNSVPVPKNSIELTEAEENRLVVIFNNNTDEKIRNHEDVNNSLSQVDELLRDKFPSEMLKRFHNLSIDLYDIIRKISTPAPDGLGKINITNNKEISFIDFSPIVRINFEKKIQTYIFDDDSIFYNEYLQKFLEVYHESDTNDERSLHTRRNLLYMYNTFIYDPFNPPSDFSIKPFEERIQYIMKSYHGRRGKMLILMEYLKKSSKELESKTGSGQLLFLNSLHFKIYLVKNIIVNIISDFKKGKLDDTIQKKFTFINILNELKTEGSNEIKRVDIILNENLDILFKKIFFNYNLIQIKCDKPYGELTTCQETYKLQDLIENFQYKIIDLLKSNKSLNILEVNMSNYMYEYTQNLFKIKKLNNDIVFWELLPYFPPNKVLAKWRMLEPGVKFILRKFTSEIYETFFNKLTPVQIEKLALMSLKFLNINDQLKEPGKNKNAELITKIRELIEKIENQFSTYTGFIRPVVGGSYTRKFIRNSRRTRKNRR